MELYLVSLATVAALNVMLAVGLNMISGFCGQISLGHAAFYGIGAYVAALAAVAGGPFADQSAARARRRRLCRIHRRLHRVARARRLSRDRHHGHRLPVPWLRAQAELARRRDGHLAHPCSAARPLRICRPVPRARGGHDRAQPLRQSQLDGLGLARGGAGRGCRAHHRDRRSPLQARRLHHRHRRRRIGRRALRLYDAIDRARRVQFRAVDHHPRHGRARRHRLDLGRGDRRGHPHADAGAVPLRERLQAAGVWGAAPRW